MKNLLQQLWSYPNGSSLRQFSSVALALGTCTILRRSLSKPLSTRKRSPAPRAVHLDASHQSAAGRTRVLAIAAPSHPSVGFSARLLDSLVQYLEPLDEDRDHLYLYLFHTQCRQIPSNAALATPFTAENTAQLTGVPLLMSTLHLYDELFAMALDLKKPNLPISLLSDEPCGRTMTPSVAKTVCSQADEIYLEKWALSGTGTNDSFSPIQLDAKAPTIFPFQIKTYSATETLIYLDELTNSPLQYDKVAVGGTFDHFHAGHKKLLAAAASVTAEEGRLLIGITSPSLLKNKKYGDRIGSFEQRKESTVQFLSTIAPELSVDIQELAEPMGDAATDPDIKAILVSSETIPGAHKINEQRRMSGFDPLDVIVISRRLSSVESSSYLRSLA
eukprot:gb/GECG01016674.1/.p1 GENE.gb/GECG01016674.1/~~gb/GECG01016674.1/.p1  ORF type:complete len:389 (+),score=38.51 gb/GECG01016674.1/:1-1167(+)